MTQVTNLRNECRKDKNWTLLIRWMVLCYKGGRRLLWQQYLLHGQELNTHGRKTTARGQEPVCRLRAGLAGLIGVSCLQKSVHTPYQLSYKINCGSSLPMECESSIHSANTWCCLQTITCIGVGKKYTGDHKTVRSAVIRVYSSSTRCRVSTKGKLPVLTLQSDDCRASSYHDHTG